MAKRRSLRRGPTFIQQSRSRSSEEKAVFHQVLGAGRKGVLRPFFDVSEEDKKVILDVLEQKVGERLKKL